MNLKDLNLKDLVKIGIGITAMLLIALTLNIAITINNTTVVNNYIEETNKKLDTQDVKLNTLQKVSEETQGNVTQVESNINKTLAISKSILNEVD